MNDDPDQRRGLGPLGHTMINTEPANHAGPVAAMINHADADTLARVRAVRDEWAVRDVDDASVLELWEALDRALVGEWRPGDTMTFVDADEPILKAGDAVMVIPVDVARDGHRVNITAAGTEAGRLRAGIAAARAAVVRHATVTPGQRAILAAVFDAAIAGPGDQDG